MVNNLEFKSAVLEKLVIFIAGFSVTANEKVLEQHEIRALKYLLENSIIYVDTPTKDLDGLSENDKSGRYRFNESHRVKAEKLKIHFDTEITQIRRGK